MITLPVEYTAEERRIIRTYGEISEAAAAKIIKRNGWTFEMCEEFIGEHEYHRSGTRAYWRYRNRVERQAARLLAINAARYL